MFLPLFQDRDKEGGGTENWPSELPLLPLRNVVAFPNTLLPLSVGQPRSLRLLEDVLEGDHLLVLAAMNDPSVAEPGPEGVHEVGVVAHIERAARAEDEGYQIVVRCIARIRVVEWLDDAPYLKVRVVPFPEQEAESTEVEALRRELISLSQRMIAFFPQIPEGISGLPVSSLFFSFWLP